MEKIPSLRMMIRFLLLHCLVLSFMIASANTTSISTDQQALLALKAHITEDQSISWRKIGTQVALSVIGWGSLVISAIIESQPWIFLGLNLTCTIPSEIGNLSSLQTLNLSFNWFSGYIPSTMFNMSSLISFYFTNNTLSGKVPTKFFAITFPI